MNKTNFDDEIREDGAKTYRETIPLFIKGLGAYFSVALTSVSFMIILSFFISKTQTIEINRLFPYLGITAIFLLFYSFVTTKTRNSSNAYKLFQILKRFFDLVITSLLFFLIMPVFILITILIKVDSAGPIFFRTKRVGQFGKTFDTYKFRTMYLAPVEMPVTRIGKFLRRLDLDQLPMLYSVLEGEMSLVGPVPRLPENIAESVDIDKKILTVRPGITGLAQISRSSSLQQVIELDLRYIENWSLFLDFKIFLKTPFIVLINE
jgi:undecaprenyl phosphate N,N'-diacetylbacillosamine 1-phosphate transferase